MKAPRLIHRVSQYLPSEVCAHAESADSFEQVVRFYRALGREYSPLQAPAPQKLPNGQQLRKAFLIFDGAPDLVTSKQWISIQHPFVGAVSRGEGGKVQYQDVRDVTEIILTQKKPVPKAEGDEATHAVVGARPPPRALPQHRRHAPAHLSG